MTEPYEYWNCEAFIVDYWTGKPKPNAQMIEIKTVLVLSILEDVVRWHGPGKSEEDIFDNLLKHVDLLDNGYDFAKNLEFYHGWHPDPELVEILDNIGGVNALHDATLAWIKANNIKPKFGIGEEVKLDKMMRGIIQKIYECGNYGLEISGEKGLLLKSWYEIEAMNP
jgi:hypothetical protein